MSTYNIGFYEDLTKIIFQLSSNTHLISFSDNLIYLGLNTIFSSQSQSKLKSALSACRCALKMPFLYQHPLAMNDKNYLPNKSLVMYVTQDFQRKLEQTHKTRKSSEVPLSAYGSSVNT